MSIIGYDGRLRPVSKPLTVGMPNEFSPEAIAKINEAQPKFGEMAVKLFAGIGKDVAAYGEAVQQRDKRVKALDSQESVQEAQRKIDEERQKIMQDETLDAEGKQAKARELERERPKAARTGYEGIDRAAEMQIENAMFNAVRSIEADAHRMAVVAADANADGEIAVANANITNEFNANLPKYSAMGSLDEATAAWKKDVDLWFAGLEESGAFGTANTRRKLEAAKANIKRAQLLQLGATFNERARASAKANIDINGAAAAGAPNIDAALAGADAVYDSDNSKAVHTPEEIRIKKNGVAITHSTNRTNDVFSRVDVETTQRQNAILTQYHTDGDEANYNKAVAELNDSVEAAFKQELMQLNSDRARVLESIDNDQSLSPKLRESFKRIVERDYDNLIASAEQRATHEKTKTRQQVSNSKSKAGKDGYKAVKKVLAGASVKDVGLDASGADVLSYINPTEEFIAHKKASFKPGLAAAYARQSYPGLNKDEGLNRLCKDLQFTLATMDMDNDGDGNLTGVKHVLHMAAEFFLVDSDMYQQVARTARNALMGTKNQYGEYIKNLFSQHIYKGDKSKWLEKASDEEMLFMAQKEMWLKSLPDDEVKGATESVINEYRNRQIYRHVMGISELKTRRDAAEAGLGKETPNVLKEQAPKSEVEREAATASVDAEIKALEGGKSVAEAKVVGQEAEEEFYKKRLDEEFGDTSRRRMLESAFAKANAVASANSNEWSRVYGQMYGSKHVYERLSEEKRAFEAEWGTKQERESLKKQLEDLGLPTRRSAYTSFFNFGGGYQLPSGGKIKLGLNWNLHGDGLKKDEMLEILRQHKAFGGLSSEKLKEAQEKQAQSRLEELKARRKDL